MATAVTFVSSPRADGDGPATPVFASPPPCVSAGGTGPNSSICVVALLSRLRDRNGRVCEDTNVQRPGGTGPGIYNLRLAPASARGLS